MRVQTLVCFEKLKVLDDAGTNFIKMSISQPLLNFTMLALKGPNLRLFNSSLSLFLLDGSSASAASSSAKGAREKKNTDSGALEVLRVQEEIVGLRV